MGFLGLAGFRTWGGRIGVIENLCTWNMDFRTCLGLFVVEWLGYAIVAVLVGHLKMRVFPRCGS